MIDVISENYDALIGVHSGTIKWLMSTLTHVYRSINYYVIDMSSHTTSQYIKATESAENITEKTVFTHDLLSLVETEVTVAGAIYW